uniref:Uncharacterized protein n=1 Tax=Chenopodium quinoa TaxID=63459 RepID=A0A803MR24_CHEQI
MAGFQVKASTSSDQFEDHLPVMADKLGGEGLIAELCNGFELLMDKEKGVITFESLRNNSALLGKMQGQNEEKSEGGVTNIQEEEITYVRKRLTENLVTNFDTERCCLMLPKRKQEIFLETIDVHLAYGLPLGGKKIEQPNDESNLKWSKFLKAWRSKFGLKKGSPTNKRLIDRIQELKKEKTVSDEFLWNFVKIAELDWCTFVIEHLKDSVNVWKKGNSYFTGPLPFLMVFYFDRLQRGGLEKPRKCPLISVWTKERIQVRYKFEKDHGFGYGKILERMESIVEENKKQSRQEDKEKRKEESSVGFLSKFRDLAKTLASNVKEMYGMLEKAKDLFVEEETTGKMQHLIDNIWCKYTTKTFVNQEEKKSPSILSQDQHVFDEPAFIEELDMVMDKAWKKFEEKRSPKTPTVDLRSKEEEKDKNKEERNEENKDKNLLIPSPVVENQEDNEATYEEVTANVLNCAFLNPDHPPTLDEEEKQEEKKEEEKEEKKEEKEKKKEEEKEEKQEKGKKKEEEKEKQEKKKEEKEKKKEEEKKEIQEEKKEEKGKKKEEEKEENQEEKKENEGSKNEEKNKEEKNENKKGKQGEEKGEEKTRKKRGKDKLPMYLRSPFMVEHEKLFKNVDNRKVAEYAFAQGDNKELLYADNMGTTITRDEIHSLIEDNHMLNNVVDAYVCLLNFENKRRGVDKKSRFFFTTECYFDQMKKLRVEYCGKIITAEVNEEWNRVIRRSKKWSKENKMDI